MIEVNRTPRAPIEVLPDTVVDQIAAGEVVERPASIVKELVENAIDASATAITVEIEDGGRQLIRVLDNGHGIAPHEISLALTRHATSKLTSIDDLEGIRSLGFRGEALPSIASVSKLEIVTRTEQDQAGLKMASHGGKLAEPVPCPAPVGTVISVAELFYNTPARKKFLKGKGTEVGHVVDTMARIALAHPKIHFKLKSQGRMVLEAPAHRDTRERVKCILGSKLQDELLEVRGAEEPINVWAFVGGPKSTMGSSRGMYLLVNGRAVRDRNLIHNCKLAFGELLARGRYPVAVVYLDMPGSEVDINVHPQKTEVRFRDAGAVQSALRRSLRRGIVKAKWHLEQFPNQPTVVSESSATARPVTQVDASGAVSAMGRNYAMSQQRSLLLKDRKGDNPYRSERKGEVRREMADRAPVRPQQRPLAFEPTSRAVQKPIEAEGSSPEVLTPRPKELLSQSGMPKLSALRLIGMVDDRYMICEGRGELLLIDRESAREALELARMTVALRNGGLAKQALLFPKSVAMANGKMLMDHQGTLEGLGFELRELDDGGLGIQAAPEGLGPDAAAAVLEELASQKLRSSTELEKYALPLLARHRLSQSGAKETQALDGEGLLAQLAALADGHGPMPKMMRLSMREIDRRFGR